VLAVAVVAATLGLPTASAAPGLAGAPPVTLEYDALGDSYASGFGVPPYDGACGRSQAGYPPLVDGRMRIALDDFVACGGATTGTLVTGGQLEALDESTRLVTLSIGGNDTGWSQAVGACLVGDDRLCATTLGVVTNRITTVLPGLLDAVYAQVAAAAPNAHVVVTGYPRLFSPEHGPFLGASVAEQEALNAGADLLNAVIAEAAAEHGFQFVDVTERFAGHGVNAPEPWILGPADPGSFHPTAEGYRAYAAAVTAAIKPGQLR
jgi:lysophospholipase L1-like esterase